MSKRNSWMLFLGSSLVALSAWAISISNITMNEPYPGDDGAASGALQNAGHIFTLQTWLPYNEFDIVVVTWSDAKKTVHYNQGLTSFMWKQVGPPWNVNGTPPAEVCDYNADIPGCKPALTGYSASFQNCPPGCGHSPYLLSWYSNNATSFEAEFREYTTWYSYYSGSIGEVLAGTGTQYSTDFRVRAVNSYGASAWSNMTLHVQCSDTQDPW